MVDTSVDCVGDVLGVFVWTAVVLCVWGGWIEWSVGGCGVDVESGAVKAGEDGREGW